MVTKSIIDVYSQISKANPVWTREEEESVVKKLCNKENMDKFVNEAMKHNLGIVFKAMEKTIVKRHNEDIFQKAVIAMVDALRKFDPNRGVRISTWVTQPVYWAIQQAQNSSNHEGSIAEELVSLNIKSKKNKTLKHKHDFSVVSIDTPLSSDGDSNETLANMITINSVNVDYSQKLLTDDERCRKNDIVDGVNELVKNMGSFLSQKEEIVVRGILNGSNLAQIAVEMNLSRVRISQLCRGAMDKIRNSKFAPHLKGLL